MRSFLSMRWLLFSALNFGGIAIACTNPPDNIFGAILKDGNAANQNISQYLATQKYLDGMENSAVNGAQLKYIEAERAYNNALLLDSMCHSTFYANATGHIGDFLTCEAYALPFVFAATKAISASQQNDFNALGQKANWCPDAPYPPISIPATLTDASHPKAVQSFDLLLNLTGKLANIQSVGIASTLKSLATLLFLDQVPQGLLLAPNADSSAVDTKITSGYKPPGDPAANLTAQDLELMKGPLGVSLTLNMVALEPNFTNAQLQEGLNKAFASDNFTSQLASLNGTVVGKTFSTTIFAASSTATATSSAPAAGATKKSNAEDGRVLELGTVWLVAGLGILAAV